MSDDKLEPYQRVAAQSADLGKNEWLFLDVYKKLDFLHENLRLLHNNILSSSPKPAISTFFQNCRFYDITNLTPNTLKFKALDYEKSSGEP